MIKDVLEHLGGIENYGLLSIALFFVFFLGMLVWAGCLKKPLLKTMAALPLEPDANLSTPPKSSHE